MNDQNSFTNDPKTRVGADADAARERFEDEKQAAAREFDKARAAIGEQASSMAHEAQEEIRERGEALKDQAADGLKTFADAVRSARDELDKKDMGPISGLVGQAAEGLESLSRNLQGASAGEMVDKVRDFGRRHPVSFIAASVLAGIAIGRFAGASAQHDHARPRTGAPRPPQGPRPTPAAGAYGAAEPTIPSSRTGGMS
ncbi:hypothetical protein EJC49_03750 [Aquibium carbonis]|uniref:Nutrient deprivation-induced protein n=1 Tax=Aquibium carbonis TaxID=2495581 RepID=A0A429Z200_9HYPH|nr:hypothetical protein [Aquibium carbonis]RST87735.1 hypothetical protein EJC49_03750 [Aquibium carbonis]